jgi:hypothetical protein
MLTLHGSGPFESGRKYLVTRLIADEAIVIFLHLSETAYVIGATVQTQT